MHNIDSRTRNITYSALFVAIISICSIITIPTPVGVPFTLQTFSIALCGYILNKKYSVASVLTYLIIGCIGLPVFSGFQGGFGILIGKTGGFLIGFMPFVFLCSLASRKALRILLGIIGLLVCHIFGILWFAYITGIDIRESILLVSLPYLIKDILSLLLAYFFETKVRKIVSIQTEN